MVNTKGVDWGESNYWVWREFNCHWRLLGSTSKKPIVLIHGFGASSEHWRNNACQLQKAGFSIYSIDLAGFGETYPIKKTLPKRLNNKVWSEQVVDFLEKIVQANQNNKAILIGNSLGSLTALTTISERPDLVSSVIAAPLPDPALTKTFHLPEKGFLNKLTVIGVTIFYNLIPLEILIPLIAKSSLIKLALQAAYYKSIKSDKALLRLVTKPALKKSSPKALRAMCIGMTLRSKAHTAPVMLKKLSQRSHLSNLLLIWGSKDNLVPLKLGRKLVKKHPWIKLSVMESSGHCPHDESPTRFNKIVLDWIAQDLDKNPQRT